MKQKIFLALALCLTMSAPSATAQTNGSNSPYSYYGLGLLNDRTSALSSAMGGATTALRGNRDVNVQNPASFSAIDSLTFLFDIGLTLQNANLDEAGRKVNAHNTSVDYVTMGFKVAPRLGLSLGMVPFSTVGYKMTRSATSQTNTGEVTETDVYSGDGGIHEAYLGAGWEPFRGLSLGVTGGYLWGDLSHSISATMSDASSGSRKRNFDTEVRSYKVDFGLQYTQRLGRKSALTLGARYSLGHTLEGKSTFSDVVTVNSATSGDTLTLRNGYELPHTFGVGLCWETKKLRISADYALQKWGDVKSPAIGVTQNGGYSYTAAKGAYTDMSRYAIGAEYTPNAGHYNPRKHLRFRAGLSYTTPYTRINGADGPKHYAASLGVGIPILNSNHSKRVILLNLGGQYERVEPSVSGMLKENYLRLSIGLSFNEQWFAKWKAL
ncbi:MAG: hypothetical protein IJ692_06690 [Alloprevotella sp.]|nr:hypothetical protein [Alloprevotella sp.]